MANLSDSGVDYIEHVHPDTGSPERPASDALFRYFIWFSNVGTTRTRSVKPDTHTSADIHITCVRLLVHALMCRTPPQMHACVMDPELAVGVRFRAATQAETMTCFTPSEDPGTEQPAIDTRVGSTVQIHRKYSGKRVV